MEWRKGNTVSASGWIEAMEKVWRSPLAQHRIRLNRGDIGFGQEPIMAWHEQGQGSFWKQCEEDFSAYVTNLRPEVALEYGKTSSMAALRPRSNHILSRYLTPLTLPILFPTADSRFSRIWLPLISKLTMVVTMVFLPA